MEKLGNLPFLKKRKKTLIAGSIRDRNEDQFQKGLMNCIFYGRESIDPNLIYQPKNYFEASVSSYARADGTIRGLFLFHENSPEEIEIVLLQAIGRDSNQYILGMMRNAYLEAVSLYSAQTQVIIPQNSPESVALAAKLFPKSSTVYP